MLKKWILSPLVIIFLTLLLSSPALFTGYFGDDYMHHALFQTNSPVDKANDLSLFGLFSFVNGDVTRTYQLMDNGLLPWWTNPDLKYAFWRPITEITHWIDHQLWPNSPALMHAQNIAWYLVLTILAWRLFARTNSTLSKTIPALAMLLYALDSSHGFTISWIANRNSLIAVTFGLASLNLYIRWHDQHRQMDYVLSLVFLGLSLLSAEFGISTCAYLGAFALFLDRSGSLHGLIRIIPHASLTVLWWLIYKIGNFGAANADAYYLDPIASPLTFLSTLGERLLALIGSQWGLVPAEVFGFIGQGSPTTANIALIIGAGFTFATLFLLTPLLKHNANVRFWFFGMLFSALPVCAAAPHDRVLLFIGLGGSYCTATIIYSIFKQSELIYGKLKRPARVLGYPFAFTHLILAPLLLPIMAYSTKIWSDQIDLSSTELKPINDLESKEVVLFNVPMASALATTTTRVARNQPLSKRLWVISTTKAETVITRLSAHTLKATKPEGFVTGPELATRNLNTAPISKGEIIPLSGLTIKVINVSQEGHPTEILLTFSKTLDDPNLLLLDWNSQNKRFRQVILPKTSDSHTFNKT